MSENWAVSPLFFGLFHYVKFFTVLLQRSQYGLRHTDQAM